MLVRKCSLASCEMKHYSKGYCNRHWDQMRRNGKITYVDNMRQKRSAKRLEDRLAIPLGINAKDGYAIVDVEDGWVDRYNWHMNAYGYASTKIKDKSTLMHRLLIDAPKGCLVDHKNHDTLDNRRSNLRICDASDSNMNKYATSNNKHGVKGVYYHKGAKKFAAQIKYRGTHYYLGLYDSVEAAATAYTNKAKELSPDFYVEGRVVL